VGYFHSKNKDSTKASEAYAKAAAIALDAGDKAVINRELGLCYYELKKFKQAEAAYLESLKTIPDDPMTLNNLAYMYVSDLNEPAKALPYSQKAAQLAPNNPDILDTYGWALAKTGKFVDAEAQLLRAVQLSDSPLAATLPRYHLGWVQEQTQRFSEALRQYRQVADILKGQSDNPLNAEVSQAMTRAQQKQAK
jgi:Tfp pilus assembly protein PilF